MWENRRKFIETERKENFESYCRDKYVLFLFFRVFSLTPKSLSSDWILVNWQEMKKTEWLLRGVIKNTSIVSICYNAHFIPDFQCLLQAFSQCVSWRHSKPEALGIMKLFS